MRSRFEASPIGLGLDVDPNRVSVMVHLLRCFSVALALVAVGSLTISVSPAVAVSARVFGTDFGAASNPSPTPANPYPLSNPSGVAVDNSSGTSAGDIYVTDPGNHRVEKFTASGEFILMLGKDVNQTTGGNVCTAVSGNTCKVGTSGSAPGEFETPTFLAVDDSTGTSMGDVYVGDSAAGTVSKFEADGTLVTVWGSGGQLSGSGGLDGIAVNHSGELFVLRGAAMSVFAPDGTQASSVNLQYPAAPIGIAVSSGGNIYTRWASGSETLQFNSSGGLIHEIHPPPTQVTTGLAIDTGTGDLYIDQPTEVAAYGPSVELLETFGSPHIEGGAGIAVSSTHSVYVANSGDGDVAVFPLVILPNVTTTSVTNPGQTSVTLTGHVDPAGGANVTSCRFEYGTDTSYSSPPAQCLDSGGNPIGTPGSPITSPTEVHANITGLTPETTYHYRLDAGNEYGSSRGPDQTFTPHWVPGLSTDPATNIERNGATLRSSFEGNGEDTHYYFEWGTDASYGNITAVPPGTLVAAPSGHQGLSFDLGGLTAETTYHYRVVASNAMGTTVGGDQSFQTLPAVENLSTAPASNITPTSATLSGSWTGNGEDTHYYFVWGATTSYGNVTTMAPGIDGGSGVGVQSGAFQITGLEPAMFYHFRIVASNSKGTTVGPDQRFETTGLPIYSYTAAPSTTQAGGHPDIVTSFSFATQFTIHNPENIKGTDDAKNITNQLATGVVGNPHAVPQCTRVEFNTHTCPVSSQVGWVRLGVNINSAYGIVFNMEPGPDQSGLLAFYVPLLEAPQYLVFSARTGGDYGLDVTLVEIERSIPFDESTLTLWGVPAEHRNDADRAPFGSTGCTEQYPCFEPNTSDSELTPFLDNPTSCGEPLSSSLELEAYNLGVTKASDSWPATTGCDQLSFNPSLYAQPTTKQADSPSGLDVDLSVPQLVSPTAPAPSEIRALTVTLPKGMSINPNAADGKRSCSETEARFGTEEEAQCPESSKVGTATLDSSTLPAPIPGAIYIGEPEPGNRYRPFLTANGYGTHVKLAGSVEPNAETGELVVSFQNLPQSPFSEFNLHFFGSERGLLATPTQCGTYPVQSTFTPWDAVLPVQTSTQYFKIEEGPGGGSCPTSPRPFAPSFTAGVAESTAAAYTPFSLELTRPDGDQDLSALNVTTPPGFSATLKGIPYCSGASLAAVAQPSYSGLREQSSPSCPAASQIGTAQAGAGAGDHPVYLPGKVYLAGPYKGAPLSLAVITPAVSGPYDLGNVVVRAALHVNPETAQITTVSDPLPQILQGIPLQVRRIRINLNRPNLVLNPTNCDPFSVDTEVFGAEGAVAKPSAHFQVANCRVLGFAPKLSMRLTGSTKRAGTPSLHATLAYPPGSGYANTGRAVITLPPTEIVDNAHINNPCTRVVFAEGSTPGEKCPTGSVLGFAKAETPLLEKPLEGPVYLRSSGRHLPDLVAALNGQIDLTLDGRIDTLHNGAIRTSFETPPDAPVSNFTLTLDGGNKGLLQNNTNLCKHSLRVSADITGQNGKTANQNPVLSTPCAKKHHKRARLRRARRAHQGAGR